jgi:hypothetical protein
MPADVYVDSLDLDVESVEAIPPTPKDKGVAYPYVALRPTGSRSTRTFRTVVLENAFTRLTLMPDLGGRIIEWRDKRTAVDILPQTTGLALTADGPRGAWAPIGIQLIAGEGMRRNALGPVDFQLQGDDGSVVMHEMIAGLGLSWHAAFRLDDEAAVVRVVFRLYNRGFTAARAASGLLLPGDGWRAWRLGQAIALESGGRGFAILSSPGEFGRLTSLPSGYALTRGADLTLAPRDSDAWELALVPFSGIGIPAAASEEGVMAVDPDHVVIQAARRLSGKLFLLTSDDQTLEAGVDAYPERALEIMLAGPTADPQRLMVRNAERREVLDWSAETPASLIEGSLALAPAVETAASLLPEAEHAAATGEPPRTAEEAYSIAVEAFRAGDDPSGALALAVRSPLVRPAALVLRAMTRLRRGEHALAASDLEDALLYNANDHLAWWLKAVALRLAGGNDPDAERPELLNAHYLAPLEPALRAESFLAQPQSQGSEPNPIVGPLGDDPDALLEVACLLLECGLHQEASRWIDEALRHRETPMLRYLMAWSYLQASRMEAEAAEQVRRAAGETVEPPYPWRWMEARAIRDLAERFPDEARLVGLRALL